MSADGASRAASGPHPADGITQSAYLHLRGDNIASEALLIQPVGNVQDIPEIGKVPLMARMSTLHAGLDAHALEAGDFSLRKERVLGRGAFGVVSEGTPCDATRLAVTSHNEL